MAEVIRMPKTPKKAGKSKKGRKVGRQLFRHPSAKRYTAERRSEKNKARRAAKRIKHLMEATSDRRERESRAVAALTA